MADVANVNNKTRGVDDDEKYLYGENSDLKKTSGGEADGKEYSGVEDLKREGDDEDEGEFEESDDDDDDNIQVHIGDVNAANTSGQYGTPATWKKDNTTAAKPATLPTQGPKKIDVNAVGLINGQPIYEYDIDADQDEKPWRKPGADISDYFNYGFTEDTWKQYCEKQRRMRMESARGPYSVTQSAAAAAAQTAQVEIEVLPDGRTRVKAGPPPDRKVEGSIHVLGSDADARRKQKEDELLALALGQSRVMAPQPFATQRPLYTALPGGAVMYNPIGQPLASSQPNSGDPNTQTSGTTAPSQPQGQQIQSIGPNVVPSGLPPGLQYIPGVGGLGGPPQQIFPPPANMGMEFPPPDHFGHQGMPPPFGFGPNSDSEFDSDGENRRHRRRESSRHSRRHRDRGERDRDRDRDRDRERSKRDRERSSSRRSRDQSKSSSDRKRHSSRSTSAVRNDEEEQGERKSRSSRRSKHTVDEDSKKDIITANSTNETTMPPPEIKQEPTGE